MLLLPNCKINIGLNVISRRADGYHNIETVFYPIPLRDNIEFKLLGDDTLPYRLTLSGNALEGDASDNLVIKVYLSLKKEYGLPSLDIFLHKKIPLGAGLGGGSSDAAFMMQGINEFFDLGLSEAEQEQRLANFGADCAFFVKNRPAFATGIGNILSPSHLSLREKYIVLVKPDVSVSTREAYSRVVPMRRGTPLLEAVSQPIETWRDTVVNDFEESVFPQYPELAAIKQTLYDIGAVYAAMSGSGSTIYGIFTRPVPEVYHVFARHFVFMEKLIR